MTATPDTNPGITDCQGHPVVVELCEHREGDRMLVRIADYLDADIYGTARDVEPYLIEPPLLSPAMAVRLAHRLLEIAGPLTTKGTRP